MSGLLEALLHGLEGSLEGLLHGSVDDLVARQLQRQPVVSQPLARGHNASMVADLREVVHDTLGTVGVGGNVADFALEVGLDVQVARGQSY